MAKTRNSQDMLALMLYTLDGVAEGRVTPRQGAAMARIGDVVIKLAIAESRLRPAGGEPSGFFQPQVGEGRIPNRIGPKFNWEDDGEKSYGEYIGTKITMIAFKSSTSYGWSATLESAPPIGIGNGDNAKTLDSAKRYAEACATEYMDNNSDEGGMYVHRQ